MTKTITTNRLTSLRIRAQARILRFAALAAATLALVSTAHAGTITVNIYAPDGYIDDGRCNFREAVYAAYRGYTVYGCTATTGWNEIILNANVELTYNKDVEVRSDVTVSAQISGGYQAEIRGNGSRIVVKKEGNLELNDIHLMAFDVTPLTVESGYTASQLHFLRGGLQMYYSQISDNNGHDVINQSPSIFNNGGNVSIYDTVIQRNTQGIKGGAIFNQNGRLIVDQSALVENDVGQYGGAISNVSYGWATITRSLISGNRQTNTTSDLAQGGGGIYNDNVSTMEIDSSTITNNSAAGHGSGIKNDGGSFTVKRSILSGNGDDCYGTVTSSGYNVMGVCPGTTLAGTDISSASPALTPINEGSGDVMRFQSPTSGSPARNAIPTGSFCYPGEQDQLHQSRPLGSGCDIGAVEVY